MEKSEIDPMPFVRFDPAAMRLWRQAEALAARVDRVHVLLARSSPAWSRRGTRPKVS